LAVFARILLYTIPSLTLIWYLLLKAKKIKEWGIHQLGKKDLISGLMAFPCLLITGFAVAAAASSIGGNTAQIAIYSPTGALGWIILCFYCLFSAYLEESFFRFYLLSRRNELNLSASSALVLSVVLFSICHIYEGPWGFLNSVLAGTILAFTFLRYNSLHGIAIAHALYNITAYGINAILTQ